MKIKLDENLPVRLVGVLAHYGHDTDTVIDENLARIKARIKGARLELTVTNPNLGSLMGPDTIPS